MFHSNRSSSYRHTNDSHTLDTMGLLDFPWLTEAVKKRALRYLLQRYMGHFLAEKLSLEQLSIDLYDGKGCIRDLTLDVDGLNDELVFLPFRFTSGCEISEISCSVPWSSLTTDSCSLEIYGATFFLNFCNSKDEDDHLYESSYLSKSMMSSSMQMAEEIASEYDRDRENSNSGSSNSFEGLEMMAQLIDSVLRRVKVVATDTRIIMKSASSRQTPSPTPSPESGSSIEFKIKRLMCEEDGIDQNIGTVYTPGNIDKRLTLEGVEVAINGRPVSKIGGKHLIQIKASQDKSDLQIFLASPLLAVISSHELKSFFDVFNTPPVPDREPLCGQHRFGSKPMTQEHFFNVETILQQDAQTGQHQPMTGLHFQNYGMHQANQNLMTGAGSPLHSQNRWSDGLHQQDKQFHPLTDSVMADDSIGNRSRTNSRVEHSGSSSSNFSCFIKIPGIYLCLLQKSDQQSLPFPVIPLIQVEFEKINQFLNDIVKDRNHIRLIAFPIHLNISKSCINAIIGDAMLIEKSFNNTELPLFWSESQDKHITSPKYRCEFRPNNSSSSSSSPSSTVVHIEGHETTCLTIDPTILERLHEYISDLTDSNTSQSLDRNSSSGLEFEIKSRLLKINLLFPIPDLRDEDETSDDDVGSSLRSDAVMFVVEEVLITTNRRCTKAVFDDLKAILNEKGKEPVIFLEATRNPVDQIEVMITQGPASICINDEDDPESFLYSDMGDSVYYSNMNHREKTTAFRVKKKLITSSSGAESENESVIGPSDRENTLSFVNQAKACTGFQIEIHIPTGDIALDQKQLDLIYNRFGNDLVFWSPKKLKNDAKAAVSPQPIVNVYKPCVSALAASTESVDSDSSFHSTADAAGLTQIKNQCVVVVEVDELSVSFLNRISGATDQRIRGQKVSLNIVIGLEDEKKTVIFLNGEKASFTHMKDSVIQCNTLDGDQTNNNVDLTFEIHKVSSDFKKIKIAIGIESAALFKTEAEIFKHFWDFINVTDEPVLGYIPPSVTTELHISLIKGAILLESSETRPALVTFDHLYITSRVVKQNCETLLRIRLEEGSIYFSKSLKSYFSPLTFSASRLRRSIRDYVCILESGLTELSVKIKEEGRFELNVSNNVINMRVCSDSLSALCQMIVHFASTKQQTNSSSSLESLDAAVTENHVTEFDVSDVQAGLEDREEDLLRDAINECSMDDGDKVSIRSCENCDSMGRQASDESGFWILGDDDVGTGITASAEPVIRKLTNDPIVLKENHFASSRSRPLPDILKETVQRFMLEQLTIICNFYAGKDFNDEVSEGSSDSLRETPGREEKEDSLTGAGGIRKEFESSKGLRVTFKDDPESEPQVNLWESLNLVSGADTAFNSRKDPNESNTCRRNSSFDGGKGRQNDVCVQLYLSKIKSLFETFEPNFNVSWRFVFMVQDIEIKDKVSHSRINKMLYEYCSESMPRRNHVNMISVKATSRKNPDDNNDECELKVSAKPLRINIDQDTLMFLIDFFTSISTPGAAFPSHPTSAASHSPRSVSQTSLDKVSEPDSTSDGEKDEESDAVSKNLPATSSTPKGSRKGSISSSVSRPPVVYVKSFIFSPDVPIRLDYQGKRLDFEKVSCSNKN